MKKPTKGDVVACTFLDHVEDGDYPIQCTVYGELVKDDNLFITVRSWSVQDPDADQECNRKDWCIVRSAIIQTKKLS